MTSPTSDAAGGAEPRTTCSTHGEPLTADGTCSACVAEWLEHDLARQDGFVIIRPPSHRTAGFPWVSE